MHGPVMHTVTASALECHAASEASAFVFGISLNFSGLSGPYNRLGRRRSATISQDEGPACSSSVYEFGFKIRLPRRRRLITFPVPS